MATTVFPQTDDVVTRTAWQSLHDTISHGDFQDVAADSGLTRTTDRLLFHRDISGSTATSLVAIEETTITLQAGHTYYVNGCLSISKPNADTTDDRCHTGIRLGAGLTVHAATCRSNAVKTGSTAFVYILDFTGSVDEIINGSLVGTNNVTFFEEPAFWVDMIVVADQTADLSFFYQKVTDNNSTWYRLDELTYLKATAIKG
jgi:hypothetical protein